MRDLYQRLFSIMLIAITKASLSVLVTWLDIKTASHLRHPREAESFLSKGAPLCNRLRIIFLNFFSIGTFRITARKSILDGFGLPQMSLLWKQTWFGSDISAWARGHFNNPLSANTAHRCIQKRKLKLYSEKKSVKKNITQIHKSLDIWSNICCQIDGILFRENLVYISN